MPSPRSGKGDRKAVDEAAIKEKLNCATSSASFLGTFPDLGEGYG